MTNVFLGNYIITIKNGSIPLPRKWKIASGKLPCRILHTRSGAKNVKYLRVYPDCYTCADTLTVKNGKLLLPEADFFKDDNTIVISGAGDRFDVFTLVDYSSFVTNITEELANFITLGQDIPKDTK